MSFSASLSAALSGLNATRRAVDVVSSNVANSLTEGYGRRSLTLTSASLGGVQVVGVTRDVDIKLVGDRRVAQAAVGEADALASAMLEIENLFGEPGALGSLQDSYSRFEAAMISASSRPDVSARLDAAARSGVQLAEKFGEISDGIQNMRMDADQSISRQVDKLNTTLGQVADLNAQIYLNRSSGQDLAGLQDQRQILIDSIADIIPLKQVDRGNGTVALFTPTGGVVLDGTAAEFGYSPVNVITADMTVDSGALSPLTLNGTAIGTQGKYATIAGGSLAASFAVRDEIAVEAQAGLDMLARDLVERFEDPALDTTLVAGDPGLFTDSGAALDPLDEAGLAGRLEFNRLADPDEGGNSWLLRDGLGAVSEGAAGNSSLLNALTARLTDSRAATSAAATGLARSAGGHAADLLSTLASERESFSVELSYHSTRYESLKSTELAGGVDTDRELQQLLVIEQAYAANAKVLQTIEQLIEEIMAI
ncbi:flagellar hook-associated protein FlgK [Vannielia sp.]|uniref:flagellar hook-associated protein FlgK n=1 Tax=Vannielia sp. TaxID=2813045 RepID=UPI0026209215|nr:flagellar hook-associated protein FlgK [Vannielia sp.]MDF1872352.1 flagellar hook-associated protein FlgK [Vannielia sp.]